MSRKRVLLVGGGHSHSEVLWFWGRMRRAQPEVLASFDIGLISDSDEVAYSGLLPGYLAGLYSRSETCISLRSLAGWAGADFHLTRVRSTDLKNHQVVCEDGRSFSSDVLSFNLGARPLQELQCEAIPLKPLGTFLRHWEKWEPQLSRDLPLRVAVVGGGAAAVEMAVALRARSLLWKVVLISPQAALLHSHGVRAAQKIQQRLRSLDIEFLEEKALRWQQGKLYFEESDFSGLVRKPEDFALVFWATGAQAPSAPFTEFPRLSSTLEFLDHPGVFAAGDLGRLDPPLPASGVLAVRQGHFLGPQILRCLGGKRLLDFPRPRRTLNLITSGNRRALFWWGPYCVFEGSWAWYLKDWIDRNYIRRIKMRESLD